MSAPRPPIFILQDNPDFFYRAVADTTEYKGKYAAAVSDVLDDFASTGQIRGTPTYNREAYFLRGSYWDPIASPQSNKLGLTIWGEPYTNPRPDGTPKSMKITVDPRSLDVAQNPLYGPAGGFKNQYASVPENFPVTVHPATATRSVYPQIQPNPNPDFIDVVDPRFRSGIRMQANTGEIFYDRITPLLERPLSTHAANIGSEARIIGNAIKANPGAAAGTALGVAGAGLTVLDMYNRAEESSSGYRSKRDSELGKGEGEQFSYTQEFLREVGARLPGFAEASANAATFGGYDFGKKVGETTVDLMDRSFKGVEKMGERYRQNKEKKR